MTKEGNVLVQTARLGAIQNVIAGGKVCHWSGAKKRTCHGFQYSGVAASTLSASGKIGPPVGSCRAIWHKKRGSESDKRVGCHLFDEASLASTAPDHEGLCDIAPSDENFPAIWKEDRD